MRTVCGFIAVATIIKSLIVPRIDELDAAASDTNASAEDRLGLTIHPQLKTPGQLRMCDFDDVCDFESR